MHYFEVELFYGFPVTQAYREILEGLDKRIFELYVRNDDAYLQDIEHNGSRYLGKSIGPIVELSTLELLQLNIYSLLKKLAPDFHYETVPLRLVPIVGVIQVNKSS